MSFLAPLYLLGGLALSLPVLLHLIRRTPRGKQPFSSLMFLTPSPPRITRRSRIEHWWLLILRGLALALLAAAFARPFLRSATNLLLDQTPGRQVAILLDSSASMRRGDLWQQAIAAIERQLSTLRATDMVALYTFDRELHSLVPFPEPGTPPSTQLAAVRSQLAELRPTWHPTALGASLATLADSLSVGRRDRGEDLPGQIVLVSDLQQGANLSALQGYDWPRDVQVSITTVRLSRPGNAAVRLLGSLAADEPRVRVSNSADSPSDEFRVGWAKAAEGLLGETSVYVPAGQSRVVKLPARPAGTDRIRLVGDGCDFDNDFYLGPPLQSELAVAFLGDDSVDDQQGLRFFLARVWTDTPSRRVTVQDIRSTDTWELMPGKHPHLAVAAGVPPAAQQSVWTKYLEAGGVGLLVVADEPAARSAGQLIPHLESTAPADPSPTSREAAPAPPAGSRSARSAYALLTNLDFTHPLLDAFADPRYGDFTKIRFWKHQKLRPTDAAQARLLARFDDGWPALWEQPIGQGRLLVLTSSWRPADSQLAVSSKFVPLLSSVLAMGAGSRELASTSLLVGEPLDLPNSEGVVVRGPVGDEVKVPAGTSQFLATETPGEYAVRLGEQTRFVAINLAAAESETAEQAADCLEPFGVRSGRLPTAVEQRERERQMRDLELESRQKLWKWLLVAVMAVLGVETWLGGYTARKLEVAA